MPIPILYEDNHVVAVSKPSGQVTIPGRGELGPTPLNKELEAQTKKKVFVVHRLDRGASGIVLFAKDAPTHKALSQQFENRSIQKTYWVLAQGRIETGGTIDQPIRAFGSGRMGVDPQGKPSVTEYAVREPHGDTTLLEVMPHTGRRHQIRVHLFSIGHPVMGDTLYGKDRPVGGAPRLMLHAWKLAWTNENGERIAIEDQIPPDFRNVLK